MQKREKERIIKRLEVKFQTSAENTAITSNLSESGMFIRTKRGINPGSVINIKLNLPGSKELFLTGKVIRSKASLPGLLGESKSGIGVSLINPSADYVNYVLSLFN